MCGCCGTTAKEAFYDPTEDIRKRVSCKPLILFNVVLQFQSYLASATVTTCLKKRFFFEAGGLSL